MTRCLVSFVLSLLLPLAAAHAADLYVAPTGADTNPGTLAKPFATLARARDAARPLKDRGPVTVYVRGGTYEMAAPLALTGDDSGVTFRAYGKEKPVLVGARRVTGFKPWKGEILQCDLKSTPLANVTFRQLFCDGKRMEMARYPNADPGDVHRGEWAYVLSSDRAPATNNSVSDNIERVKTHFTATDDVIKPAWTNVQDAQICIHPAYGWAWNICGVKSADDATNVITLANPVSYGLMIGDRYFVRNLLEELDAPGEWYLDKRTKTLYLWPPQGSSVGQTSSPVGQASSPVGQAARLPGSRSASVRAGEAARATGVYAPVTGSIVTLDKASNVTLRGFTIEACDGNAVTMDGCTGCVIAQSTIRNTGAWAVAMLGSTNCGAVGNDITATGSGGISINCGDRKSLTRGDCYADNNYIHHIAEFQRTYNTGVNLMGVGNRASHNLIHDCYHQAILVGGNDQTIEYNIIHHTNLGSEDTGGLYMSSRDFTQRGTVIRHNIFHHIGGFGKDNSWSPVNGGRVKFHYPGFTWGIYLDAPEVGCTVFGNVLYDVPVCGLFNHEGRDNTWENNIIVDAPGFQVSSGNYPDLDELSYSYIKKLRAQGGYDVYRQHYPALDSYTDDAATHHTCAPGKFVRNIMYYTADPGKYNTARRKSWNGQLVYTFRGAKTSFAGFRFDRNCVYGPANLPLKFSLSLPPEKTGMLTWDEWRQTGQDERSVNADPLFVNPAKHDYRLKPGSPALKLGFKPIPFDQIGPYKSELRASWPVVEAPGAARLGDFTTERYFDLPGYKPQSRVPAEYLVPRRSGVKVDGVLDEWPFGTSQAVMECREEYSGGDTAGLPSQACAAYDRDALYFAIRNPLRQPDRIVMTGGWGSRDGLELAFQDAVSQPEGQVLNLYGYPDGTIESLTIAGASAAQAERLRRGVTYAARRTAQGWECEWRIPWSATGLDPAKVKKLRFNLGVRKTEDKAWVVWRGTGGYNFDVAKAGTLVLAP